MINSSGFTSRLLKGIVLSLLIIATLNSCSKSSMSGYYGTGTTGGTKGGPGVNEVWIQGMVFTPSIITVSAGTSIKWTNQDAITHTVTSDSTMFNSGEIAPGGTFVYVFNTAGVFKYHCSIHPTMTARVVAN